MRLPDGLRSRAILIGSSQFADPELPGLPAVRNTLQTINHNRHRDIGTDHDAYTRAAKYPDAIALIPTILSIRENQQDPLARSRGPDLLSSLERYPVRQ